MDAPDVPASDALRFRVTLRTRWSDEDRQKVLNNAVTLTLFEEGRHAYFRELGLLEENEFPFLLLQTSVRFLSPGRGGEEVLLEMGTTRLGRSSITQAYRLRGSRGDVWSEGEAVLVTVDPQTGASRPMGERFRRAVAELEGLPPS